jgi:phosphoribosylamine---glycine ligase
MKVLLIGSGGREHALAWKLADSPLVSDLWCFPGNPGTAQIAENIPGSVSDFDAIEKYVRRYAIQFVVIGPEDPLAAGLADRLVAAGVKVFGPNRAAAQLEADKWFAKQLMREQAIPTGEARTFTDVRSAEEYVSGRDEPCVIKASGLAKGKGVTVCAGSDEALAAIDRIMRKKEFGEAGGRIVIEEKLRGPECSVMALVDRRTIYVLESAQDHKAVFDGDTGPMTGGMGAYSPTPVVSASLLSQIEKDVLIPAVDGLARDGIEYKGVLYAGLMLTANGPKVLEFNCRFGDPETQPLMLRLKSDLAEVLLAVADGHLDKIELKWDTRPAICVVAASKGYPGSYSTGLPITGIEAAESDGNVKVFHGGTRLNDNKLVTDGGRVLNVTAIGLDISDARRRAYAALAKIHFDGMHYRRDIAHQAL